jgi:dihydroorotate dehydrogenase electron transfer subunit
MTESAQGTKYADQAWHGTVKIVQNDPIAEDTYLLRLDCPEIARPIVPGQFLMVRLAGSDDPLLGRPLALYDTALGTGDEPWGLDIVYLAVGKMTRLLTAMIPGQSVEVWGPLGNGFPVRKTDHLVMVGGGIGQTPFLALAKEYLGRQSYGDPSRKVSPAKQVTLCYGVRNEAYLAGVDHFRREGVEVQVSTDDGSAGQKGLVTDLVRPVVDASSLPVRIVCCGPEPMMEATAEVARQLNVPCQVSLETPMACGLGVCFSCVTRVRDGSGGWDYRRVCVEGPVFDAEDVDFSSTANR